MAKSKTTAQAGDQYVPRHAFEAPVCHTQEEAGRVVAGMATAPETAAARVLRAVERQSGIGEQIDIPTLVDTLRDQITAVQAGGLGQAEAMLICQATALQSLFTRLAERAMGCDTIPAFEMNMRMALRAQSQCRATLETLAAVKNPPVVYARQANVTTGPQQVNNGVATAPRTRNMEIEPNRLLEEIDGQRLDTRAPCAPGKTNPDLATVGAVHRPKDGGG
jgi:hypothetical protein